MPYQIHALAAEPFAHLFTLSDEELAAIQARRMTVEANPGTPCRVSMEDAEVGETVILTHYDHQPADSPYRASHAIFVREGVAEAKLAPGTVPKVLSSRLLSVRLFDESHMMIDADVINGADLHAHLTSAFEDPKVAYIHLHNAKPGCFAASVTRLS